MYTLYIDEPMQIVDYNYIYLYKCTIFNITKRYVRAKYHHTVNNHQLMLMKLGSEPVLRNSKMHVCVRSRL